MNAELPVIFDFAEFGEPGVWPVEHEVVQLYLGAAQHMVSTYSPGALDMACDQLERGLWQQSLAQDSPTDEWIGNAVLVTAIRGIRGIKTPPIISEWTK